MKKTLFCILAVFSAILLSCNPTGSIPEPDPEPAPTPIPEPDPEPDPEPNPPVIVNSFGAYRHVFIIGVDGGGAFFSETVTPKTFQICTEGSYTLCARTAYPSISAQCWGSMLHGVPPQAHRLTNSIVGEKQYDPESPFPSIFRVVKESLPNSALASFCNWNPINTGIIEDNCGVWKSTADTDRAVTDLILSYLVNSTPTLMFVQFDSVDEAGHSSGYGSENHLLALSAVDALIGQIHDAIMSKGILDDTLFIITADHGGTPEGSHGGNTDAEMNIFLGISGKTVCNGSSIMDAEGQDVAAIAAYALGIKAPDVWTSRVPEGVFQDVAGSSRKPLDIPVGEFRKHEMVPTPEVSVTRKLLEGHDVVAYLPFDGGAEDAFGVIQTIRNGKQYYYDGYFGQGLDTEDGYITLKDVKFGAGSFSVAFWLKASPVSGDPSIISNKDWRNGIHDGFVLSLRPEDIKFNAGSDAVSVRVDGTADLPLDYDLGWMHVALVVDRQVDKVRIYYDFKQEAEFSIPETLKTVPFDALDLNVGQDGTGHYGDNLPAQIDEMIITGDVLAETDIAAMKAHYKAY